MTYETVEAHPVGVSLTARCALHLESIEIWVLLGISWLQGSDAVQKVLGLVVAHYIFR